jgi:hypothetical protein
MKPSQPNNNDQTPRGHLHMNTLHVHVKAAGVLPAANKQHTLRVICLCNARLAPWHRTSKMTPQPKADSKTPSSPGSFGTQPARTADQTPQQRHMTQNTVLFNLLSHHALCGNCLTHKQPDHKHALVLRLFYGKLTSQIAARGKQTRCVMFFFAYKQGEQCTACCHQLFV